MAYTPDEIGSRTFSITRRGYDRGEVEAFLREIARQARSGGQTPITHGSADGDPDGEQLLVQARHEADAIRADADAYAQQVRADAATTAGSAAATTAGAEATKSPYVPAILRPDTSESGASADAPGSDRAQREAAALARLERVADRLEPIAETIVGPGRGTDPGADDTDADVGGTGEVGVGGTDGGIAEAEVVADAVPVPVPEPSPVVRLNLGSPPKAASAPTSLTAKPVPSADAVATAASAVSETAGAASAPDPQLKPAPGAATHPDPDPDPRATTATTAAGPAPDATTDPAPGPMPTVRAVSDRLDHAKTLLDGVLDDVMGSLRSDR